MIDRVIFVSLLVARHISKKKDQELKLTPRDRLEEVRSASSSLTASAPQLPSSGASSSTTQSPIQSEDHEEDEVATQVSEDTNFYEAMRSPIEQTSQQSKMRQQRQKLATPSPSGRKGTREDVYSSLSSPMYSTIGSPEKAMIVRDTSSPNQFSSFDAVDSPLSVRHASLDYHRAKLTASELARASLPPGSHLGGRDERRRSRADLKKRLRQLALTSETGSASVIEVIEPNSSEEEEFKKSMQEMNISWSRGGSEAQRSSRSNGGAQPSPSPSKSSDSTLSGSRGSRTSSLELRQNPAALQSVANVRKPSEPSPNGMPGVHRLNIPPVFTASSTEALPSSKNLPEPDLLSGTTTARPDASPDPPTTKPRSPDAANDLHEEATEDEELLIDDFGDEFYNEDFSDVQMLPYDLESERSESSLQIKKKGFLQKLSLSKWTSKKTGKGKGGNKGKEIPPEDFRETYFSPRSDSGRDLDDSETVVESAIGSGITTITVGQEENGDNGVERLDMRLSKSLSPTSRKTPHYSKTGEGLSVANSDDSGILASRPMSSASKSETSLSRPDSSTSDPPSRKAFSGSQDALEQRSPPLGNATVSPPGARDSTRLGSIEEGRERLPLTKEGRETARQRATIITLHSSPANINGLPEPNNNQVTKRSVRKSSTVRSNRSKVPGSNEEKPWYDVSDDEVDLSAPDHITSIISVCGSSEDERY